ncbi:hypothetical protein [Achromobacter sp.]|uniref:hypothetical protein n=1 Tax=Achromobacter sp. TaxID=134375 RepID=UPI0028ACB89E|nr:hypothetical protein [Achromobacter sp.]
MSGFLRQLASRSLGMAPRLRSAPAPIAGARAATRTVVSAEDGLMGAQSGAPTAAPDYDAAAQAFGVDTPNGEPRARRVAASPVQNEAGFERQDHGPESAAINGATVRYAQDSPAPFRAENSVAAATAPQGATSPFTDLPASGQSASRNPIPMVARAAGSDTGQAGKLPPLQPMTRQHQAWAAQNANAAIQDATRKAEETYATRRASDSPSEPVTAARRAPPEVHITIDRLEVAPPPVVPRPAAPARSGALSLRAYLAARRSGLP